MITGVVGVTIWTDNLGPMFHFYHDVLRLPLHSRHEDWLAFELGDVRFNVGLHDRVQGPNQDPFRFMPHLGVDDIFAEHRRLEEAGVEFIRPPERENWGGWVATLKDPDGNILQLLQFPLA